MSDIKVKPIIVWTAAGMENWARGEAWKHNIKILLSYPAVTLIVAFLYVTEVCTKNMAVKLQTINIMYNSDWMLCYFFFILINEH